MTTNTYPRMSGTHLDTFPLEIKKGYVDTYTIIPKCALLIQLIRFVLDM